ncbi:PulJ/GspJ family protein [Ornithinibacillus halophilus]|uniref:Prepilin-type N-terminal cleavage/methylation domain-containing protein n=1 Tax=Ornithinibacillus halophilus TaxID=930117 RepID=A0A1M5EIJ1_9BACI|nr:type II secretion system protein [Ornithinibacillus halophilus]SHF78944.1 hypothetical protein SAMN05216225_100535 [Ornithinibacillus halophilus]
MIFRQFRQENGMTLVESLATISLFAIVIVLSSTTIFQIMGNEETVSRQVSSTQVANIVLSDLKSQYNDKDSSICIDDAFPSFSIEENSIGELSDDKKCITINDHNSSQALSIKVKSDTGTEVSSTWEKKRLKITKNINMLQNETDSDKEDFNDYIEGDDQNLCIIFTEDTKFIDYVNTKNGNSKNGCNVITFEKNAAFMNGLRLHNHINEFIVEDLYIFGDLTIQNHTHIYADNLFIIGNIHLGKGSITITENMYVDGNINFHPNSNISITKNLFTTGTYSAPQLSGISVCRVETLDDLSDCPVE